MSPDPQRPLSIRDLFNAPIPKAIGGTEFLVSKLGYDQFEDAIDFGTWLNGLDQSATLQQLNELRGESPTRLCIDRLLAGSLSIEIPMGAEASPIVRTQLTSGDIRQMPLFMVAEAIAVLLEVNFDFFTQALVRVASTARLIGWTGSALLNSSSAQGISPLPSGDTPSPSSAGS